VAVVTVIPAAGAAAVRPVPGGLRPHVGPVTEISRGCSGQNAEAEQAVDGRYVYVAWIGCDGIGFARSTNDGRSFGRPITLPGWGGSGTPARGLGVRPPEARVDPGGGGGPPPPLILPLSFFPPLPFPSGGGHLLRSRGHVRPAFSARLTGQEQLGRPGLHHRR